MLVRAGVSQIANTLGIIEWATLVTFGNLVSARLALTSGHVGHGHTRHLGESHAWHSLHRHHSCRHRIIRVELREPGHHGESLLLLLLRVLLLVLLLPILLTRLHSKHLMATHKVTATTTARTTSRSLHGPVLVRTVILLRLALESIVECSFAATAGSSSYTPRASWGICGDL